MSSRNPQPASSPLSWLGLGKQPSPPTAPWLIRQENLGRGNVGKTALDWALSQTLVSNFLPSGLQLDMDDPLLVAQKLQQSRTIRRRLENMGVDVPLVGDFHFNGHKLLKAHPACAEALGKLRINPGNVGRGSKRDPQFAEMIETAVKYHKPVRIGVNWGSLDQDLLTRMMDENSKQAEPKAAIDVMRAPSLDE